MGHNLVLRALYRLNICAGYSEPTDLHDSDGRRPDLRT